MEACGGQHDCYKNNRTKRKQARGRGGKTYILAEEGRFSTCSFGLQRCRVKVTPTERNAKKTKIKYVYSRLKSTKQHKNKRFVTWGWFDTDIQTDQPVCFSAYLEPRKQLEEDWLRVNPLSGGLTTAQAHRPRCFSECTRPQTQVCPTVYLFISFFIVEHFFNVFC